MQIGDLGVQIWQLYGFVGVGYGYFIQLERERFDLEYWQVLLERGVQPVEVEFRAAQALVVLALEFLLLVGFDADIFLEDLMIDFVGFDDLEIVEFLEITLFIHLQLILRPEILLDLLEHPEFLHSLEGSGPGGHPLGLFEIPGDQLNGAPAQNNMANVACFWHASVVHVHFIALGVALHRVDVGLEYLHGVAGVDDGARPLDMHDLVAGFPDIPGPLDSGLIAPPGQLLDGDLLYQLDHGLVL